MRSLRQSTMILTILILYKHIVNHVSFGVRPRFPLVVFRTEDTGPSRRGSAAKPSELMLVVSVSEVGKDRTEALQQRAKP